jgi:class 3 adenylate cyclase
VFNKASANMLDLRTQLASVKSKLPEDFAKDVVDLERLLDVTDFPRVLNKIRYITEKVLFQLCTDNGIQWGKDEIMLERMIDPLRSNRILPRNVAIHVETIQRHAGAGSHFRQDPLSHAHVTIALTALIEFLNWFALGAKLEETFDDFPPKISGPAPADLQEWVKRAVSAADSIQGLSILNNALKNDPRNIEFQKAKLRCLVDVGAVGQAAAMAENLREEVSLDFDLLTRLVGSQAELVRRSMIPVGQNSDQLLSNAAGLVYTLLRHAATGRQEIDAAWAGISVAVQLLVAKKEKEASTLAGMCRKACEPAIRTGQVSGSQEALETKAISSLVTAQAMIITGEGREALLLIEECGNLLPKLSEALRLPLLSQCRANLLCLAKAGRCSGELPRAVRAPTIVVFTGHMIDKPDRDVPRFPPEKEDEVTQAIREALAKIDDPIGYGSAACGGDIIFMEQLADRGGEYHLVLPYNAEDFKKHCVQGFLENPGREWEPRFNAVIKKARTITYLGNTSPPDNSMVSECCNRVFLGLAMRKAEALSTDVTLIALWDGQQGDARGGTEAMVNLAGARKGFNLIHLKNLAPSTPPASTAKTGRSVPHIPANALLLPQQICAILFADVAGFSGLNEETLPEFLARYLKPLSLLIEEFRSKGIGPIDFRTWGDGLYCGFDSVGKAGRFALELQKLPTAGRWKLEGVGEELKLRIGLHAGSVYRIPDSKALSEISGIFQNMPGTFEGTFQGTNLNFAARIEPVTPNGEIYCSDVFAALSAVEGVTDFACEYVGKVQLAKNAGVHPMYVLRGKSIA